MTEEKCNTKYCRGKVVIKYLGILLCQRCFDNKILEEDQEEIKKNIDKMR